MGLLVVIGGLLFVVVLGALYYFVIYDRGNVYERALTLARTGHFMDARSLIRARVDSDPDDPRAHYYMSRVYAIEGNEDQELVHLKEVKRISRYAAEIQPGQVIGRIAQLYYGRDRFAEAFENFLDVLYFEPNNEAALAHVSFLAIGQGQYEIAEKYFKRLVKIAPSVAEYHVARGVGLSMLRQRDEGLEEIRLGLSQSPRNTAAQFLAALQSYRSGDMPGAKKHLEELLPLVDDPYVAYISQRLAVVVYYQNREYDRALSNAERCLSTAANEEWESEEYDARMTVAYMAILVGNLEKANEHLLELEIRNPADDLVMKISDFRMDLEEHVAQVDQVSPRGFDFVAHMQDWARNRFTDDAVYKFSGLKQSQEFDVLAYFTKEGSVRKKEPGREVAIDPNELIERFNSLRGDSFMAACQSIITTLGFRAPKELPYREKDGADFIAQSVADKKVKALFRIRKWTNQPISDIFLRDQQNTMNEHKVQQGFVVAGARLTTGAEQALANLKKITVVNEMALGEILQKVL